MMNFTLKTGVPLKMVTQFLNFTDACEHGYFDHVEVLIGKQNYRKLLDGFHLACDGEHKSIVKLFLKQKLMFLSETEYGNDDDYIPNTAIGDGLIIACKAGNIGLVKLILKYSLKKHEHEYHLIPTRALQRALIAACEVGHRVIARIILKELGRDLKIEN